MRIPVWLDPEFSLLLHPDSPGFSRKQRLRKNLKQKETKLEAGQLFSLTKNRRLPGQRGKPSCVAEVLIINIFPPREEKLPLISSLLTALNSGARGRQKGEGTSRGKGSAENTRQGNSSFWKFPLC